MIEIDLSTLAPLINGPDTPDLAHAVGEVGAWARAQRRARPRSRRRSIGSCTNSSYEDITRAASIARHAAAHGLRAKTQLLVTPGSEQVRATIERDGLLADLEAIGGDRARQRVRAVHRPVGPHRRSTRRSSTRSSTATTATSRSATTATPTRKAFVTSPETVIAFALAGTLDFDPLTDDDRRRAPRAAGRRRPAARAASTRASRASSRRPTTASRRRRRRRARTASGCSCSSRSRRGTAPTTSTCPVLMKAKGKCTTDHISAAGKWLRYRGHLENISGNLFVGVINAFTGAAGEGKDPLDGETRSFPDIAKHLGEAGVRVVRGRRRRTTARARHASTRRWSRASAAAS